MRFVGRSLLFGFHPDNACSGAPEGCTGGVQNQRQQGERLPEEEPAGQRQVAAVWLSVLLLYSRLQSVARHLPQQEGEPPPPPPPTPRPPHTHTHTHTTHFCVVRVSSAILPTVSLKSALITLGAVAAIQAYWRKARRAITDSCSISGPVQK